MTVRGLTRCISADASSALDALATIQTRYLCQICISILIGIGLRAAVQTACSVDNGSSNDRDDLHFQKLVDMNVAKGRYGVAVNSALPRANR
jgi:hypothetical protein